MKVLWFSNTPANADEYLDCELKGTGGWMKALDMAMQNHVDLHVAFYSNDDVQFNYKNTSYHPIKRTEGKLDKLLRKVVNIQRRQNYLTTFLTIIHRVTPDLIHIHGTENSFGDILGQTDIPVVISIQGNMTIYRHKYFSGVEKRYIQNLYAQKGLLKSIIFKNTFLQTLKLFDLQSFNEQQYFLKCNYFIGRTDWDKRISSIMSPNSTYFHCDEILRDSFYLHEWKKKENNIITIHTTTSNSLYKGFETLCYALNLLNKAGHAIEWRIAGLNSSDSIVTLVKRKLKHLFPEKGLVFLGNLNESALVEKLLEADMYVLPSHIENSPNSLCEAMMLGIPCIATHAGGTGSILQDKIEGILIQDGDPWVMAGAIKELILTSSYTIRFGQEGRKRAALRHDKNKITLELANIYTLIIKSKNHKN